MTPAQLPASNQPPLSPGSMLSERLPLICFGVAAMFVLYMGGLVLAGTRTSTLATAFALASLLGLLAAGFLLRRRPVPAHLAEPAAVLVASLTIADTALRLSLEGRAQESVFLILVLLAGAMLLHTIRWYGLLAVITGAAWLAAAGDRAFGPWIEYGLGILQTALLGGIVLSTRRELFARQERVYQEAVALNLRLERNLRNTEESFRRMSENIPDIVFRYRVKPVAGHEYISAAVQDILGYAPEEFYADPDLGFRVVEEQDMQDFINHSGSYLKGQVAILRCRARDGSIRWLEQRTVPLMDEHGEMVAVEGISRDITEQQRARRELLQSREQLAMALTGARMGHWEWDMRTGRVVWDEQVAELFGVALADFQGTFEHFGTFIHPEDQARMEQALNAAIDEREPFVVEHRVLWPDGTTHWVRGQGRVVRDAAGQAIQLLGICQDITERKRIEQKLVEARDRAEDANRLKDAILANMSHEIRTPMTAVLGFAEILTNRLQGDELRYAQIIHDGGSRLLHLLDSIIDLARIEANRMVLQPEAHDPITSASRVVDLMRATAQKKGLTLELESAERLRVETDPRREEQILTNIVNNAIRFTETGRISVRLESLMWRGGPAVQFTVQDTGPGISAEFLPHVFEEFRQESQGFNRKYEGSGLGLSISRRLAEMMDGEIVIESRQGEGTTVRIRFPAARANAAAAPEGDELRQPRPRSTFRAGLQVLVVDDDAESEKLVPGLLDGLAEVETAATADEALDKAAVKPYDAVLMDIHLAGSRMNGIEAMQALKKASPLPIVFAVTAFAMKGDRERLLAHGFDGYLAKPFSGADLDELLCGFFPPEAPAKG